MMCKNPFVKVPTGITRLQTMLSEDAALASTPFPCGKCLPCRINRSRVWQHRLLLEATYSKASCFVTLTYNDAHVPDHYTLVPEHMTLYIKRVRSHYPPKTVRYYYVGEYGARGRPHYHIFFFGIGLDSENVIKKEWSDPEGNEIGFVHIGEVTPHSAGYIVGYVTKGLSKGDIEGRDYSKYIGYRKIPEFARMSRKPGIGHDAISAIAGRLAKSKWFKPDRVIRELTHGKRKMPLGRYLTAKLAEKLDMPDSVYDEEFWFYQQDLFERHLRGGEIFVENVIREKEGERRAQEGRYRFFKTRRVLHNEHHKNIGID